MQFIPAICGSFFIARDYLRYYGLYYRRSVGSRLRAVAGKLKRSYRTTGARLRPTAIECQSGGDDASR